MSFKSLYGSIVYMYVCIYPFIEFIGVFVLCTIINVLFITYYLLRLIVLFPVYIVNRIRENRPQKRWEKNTNWEKNPQLKENRGKNERH